MKLRLFLRTWKLSSRPEAHWVLRKCSIEWFKVDPTRQSTTENMYKYNENILTYILKYVEIYVKYVFFWTREKSGKHLAVGQKPGMLIYPFSFCRGLVLTRDRFFPKALCPKLPKDHPEAVVLFGMTHWQEVGQWQRCCSLAWQQGQARFKYVEILPGTPVWKSCCRNLAWDRGVSEPTLLWKLCSGTWEPCRRILSETLLLDLMEDLI